MLDFDCVKGRDEVSKKGMWSIFNVVRVLYVCVKGTNGVTACNLLFVCTMFVVVCLFLPAKAYVQCCFYGFKDSPPPYSEVYVCASQVFVTVLCLCAFLVLCSAAAKEIKNEDAALGLTSRL